MPSYRLINVGAIFAESLSSLADLRRRYTVTGAPTVIDTPRGRALHVSVGNNITATTQVGRFQFGTTGDFSVSFRIRSTDGSHIVLGNKRVDSDTPGFVVRFVGGPIILKLGYTADSVEIQSTTSVLDGAWHSVAFTVDRDGDSYAYVDGVQEGTVANLADGDDIDSDLDLAIGCDALGAFDMIGDLQDASIWGRALSEREVTDIHRYEVF